MELPLESDSRDLRGAYMGAPLEGVNLRAPGRSVIVARTEVSAEDATSQVGRGEFGLGLGLGLGWRPFRACVLHHDTCSRPKAVPLTAAWLCWQPECTASTWEQCRRQGTSVMQVCCGCQTKCPLVRNGIRDRDQQEPIEVKGQRVHLIAEKSQASSRQPMRGQPYTTYPFL